MLLRSTASGDYPDFKETQEHILVEPVKMGENEAIAQGGNHRHRLFDDRAPSIRAAHETRAKVPRPIPIDHSGSSAGVGGQSSLPSGQRARIGAMAGERFCLWT